MLCGDDDEWKSVITGRVVRIVSLLLLLITTFTHPIPTANYRNIATVIVSVDVDDDIDNTKPAATQHTTECCSFGGIRNKKTIIISNDGN